jgi:hypothetical protein
MQKPPRQLARGGFCSHLIPDPYFSDSFRFFSI